MNKYIFTCSMSDGFEGEISIDLGIYDKKEDAEKQKEYFEKCFENRSIKNPFCLIVSECDYNNEIDEPEVVRLYDYYKEVVGGY